MKSLGNLEWKAYDDRMPEPRSNRLMPSILDRLIDPESMGGRHAGYDIGRMIDCVRRDLEDLLNTQRSSGMVNEAYEAVRDSIVTYGLPDLHAFHDDSGGPAGVFNAADTDERKKLCRTIAAIIARYEPRLRNVHVTPPVDKDIGSVKFKFHIDAQLSMDPAPEIGFETVLELTTGKATVKPREGTR